MSADLFVVAETGTVPAYVFGSQPQAEVVLACEFRPDGDGVLRSDNDTWTGWSLDSAAVVALLYGGPQLRIVRDEEAGDAAA